MLSKLVILFCATAAFAFYIKTTPEELQKFMADVDLTVKINQSSTRLIIIVNLLTLAEVNLNAEFDLLGNLTELAKPYWDEIASIEKEAEGQNISECIELGNQQLYALNITALTPLVDEILVYFDKGNQTIYDIADSTYKVVEELLVLDAKVDGCSDDDCADELMIEAKDLLQEATDSFNSALSAANDYVSIEYPSYLANITIDADAYVKSYTSYLKDVKDCINNL